MDPDPLFKSMRIPILLLIKVMRICDHGPTEPPDLHFEPPRLYFGSPRLHLEPRRLMSYDFHALLDPAFHCNADPDAASKNNADPSGSETLIRSVKLTGT